MRSHTISTIVKSAGKFSGREVIVAGTIRQRGDGHFYLQDEDNEIRLVHEDLFRRMVRSHVGPPKRPSGWGDKAVAKGTLLVTAGHIDIVNIQSLEVYREAPDSEEIVPYPINLFAPIDQIGQ